MIEETRLRIASLTKPMGGRLTPALFGDEPAGLNEPIARWLPELAAPQVLTSLLGVLLAARRAWSRLARATGLGLDDP